MERTGFKIITDLRFVEVANLNTLSPFVTFRLKVYGFLDLANDTKITV